MSDGQTEACEANAEPRCVRLERGEAVKWHDGEQWQVGVVLRGPEWMILPCLVQTCDGICVVSPDALEPYPPRCDACGGEGVLALPCREVDDEGNCCAWIMEKCPECGGSGRRSMPVLELTGKHIEAFELITCPECGGQGTFISDVSKYLGGESIPCKYECPACGGSGRQRA